MSEILNNIMTAGDEMFASGAVSAGEEYLSGDSMTTGGIKPAVSVNAVAEDGFIRMDVIAQNMPDDFFGMAFHLRIEGGGWKLAGTEPGDFFGDGQVLFLAGERASGGRAIVAGISKKGVGKLEEAGGLGEAGWTNIQDGVFGNFRVASFRIEPAVAGEYNVFFENGLVTVFDGERTDLNDVEWGSATIKVSEELDGAYLSVKKDNEGFIYEDEVAQSGSDWHSVRTQFLDNDSRAEAFLIDDASFPYLFVILTTAVIAGIILWRLKLRQKSGQLSSEKSIKA